MLVKKQLWEAYGKHLKQFRCPYFPLECTDK